MGYFILAMIIASLMMTTLVFSCTWHEAERKARHFRYQRDILHKHFNVFAEKTLFFLHNNYLLTNKLIVHFYPSPKDLIEVLNEIEGKKTKYGKTQDLISEKAKQTALR